MSTSTLPVRRFGAPLGGSVIRTTLLALAVLALVFWLAAWRAPNVVQAIAVSILTVVALFWALLTWVRSYELFADRIRIRMPLWHRDLLLSQVTSVEVLPNALEDASRLFGNEGFFAYAGRFRSAALGNVHCYVSDRHQTVVLRTAKGIPVLVSPDNPSAFVATVARLRAGVQGGNEERSSPRGGTSVGTVTPRAKSDGILLAIRILAFIVATAMGVYAYLRLPAGSTIPVHFDLSGVPNGWADALKGLFMLPFLAGVLMLAHWIVPMLKPNISALERRIASVLFACVALVLVFGQWTIVSNALQTLAAR